MSNNHVIPDLELRFMTYNIKNDYDREGDNMWNSRRELVAGVVRFHRPDLVGMQEVLHNQLMDLEELLPEYGWIGAGREDGKQDGEYACIFYLKRRLEPLQQGHFWLSEEPETPGRLGWDAGCTRMVTWCRFRDIYTGEEFVHLNTHFDHIGQEAVKESAHLIKQRIKEMGPLPAAVLTGDFNVTHNSETYRILSGREEGEAEPLLRDASAAAEYRHFGPAFTFQGFDSRETAARLFPDYVASAPEHDILFDSDIDFIFVSRGVRVSRFGIITDHREGKMPSDHFPVVADVIVNKQYAEEDE
ncbi:endonuclease/exonuclease/phosphatase family protein [Paenibacillus sp. JX-17]|uniref:Endonuclease/exonuclease/phosphatase family protein n=1 Tax=Paenibacillus lacisoli TaxID=3064525 RepID=A0ABT9CEE1_9BACL|nr:endonuclease/exonuclease/phosphatase family protein [Paenibacillus sp. JX-17]MDO7906923.1 endonuclease/exonuclease/phosphatase family protein [Paenibacillus sp. JX-17]